MNTVPQPPSLTDENEYRQTFPSTYAVLGLAQLNQWAMDFDGNLERVMSSIRAVKKLGGYFRMGPELELSGYSCEDHFYEFETTFECWRSIGEILKSDLSHNCLLDIGMPVEHNSVRYNSRIYILNSRIILIRPKMYMANDGAYRESRWFGAWTNRDTLEEFVLPKSIQRRTGQTSCPIGVAAVQCNDCMLAAETCEELFVPDSPHTALCLGGVDIFCNGSASYYEIGKLRKRFDLIMAPTLKMGGVYIYCNMKGNDGGRTYFDGNSFIACNGEIINLISPVTMKDVEVIVERVNISKVRSFRASMPSFAIQAAGCRPIPIVKANIWLSGVDNSTISTLRISYGFSPAINIPSIQEEVCRSISVWLWDYLRRSGASGFLIPLSGGADSSSLCAIVRLMCNYLFEVKAHITNHLQEVLRMDQNDPEFPKTPQELAFQLIHTVYLSMDHTSGITQARAKKLSDELNTYHLDLNITPIFNSNLDTIEATLQNRPKFNVSKRMDISLQNIQARTRMATSYLVADLVPCLRAGNRLAKAPANFSTAVNRSSESGQKIVLQYAVRKEEIVGLDSGENCGFLLNLSSGNLDESLVGYLTKYDCSSADLAPIGSLSKNLIKSILEWAACVIPAPSLLEAAQATPTAELQPLSEGKPDQSDEDEIGLSYTELYMFGNIRKNTRCGPVEMFESLISLWKMAGVNPVEIGERSPTRVPGVNLTETSAISNFVANPDNTILRIAEKVKIFFTKYAANRHKATTLPPSMHAEGYDVDGDRHDWRPFLYPSWKRQFKQIDLLVEFASSNSENLPEDESAVTSKKHIIFSASGTGPK